MITFGIKFQELISLLARRSQQDSCGDRQFRFTDSKGNNVVTTGGTCVFNDFFANGIFKSYERLQSEREALIAKFITKKKFDKKFGFTANHHFGMPERSEFKAGFRCTDITVASPHAKNISKKTRMIFDKDLGDWRHTTVLDRACNPDLVEGRSLNFVKEYCPIQTIV